jgi:chromosome partitioning protein
MHTIAILSQKGGTGKTTLALNLAIAAETAGHSAVVIDLDPQASAKGWHDSRAQESPVVISVQATRLAEALRTAKEHGAKVVVIDTAPHSESTALAAARAADVVLIPCRPGILDLRAISASADICALAKASAVAVINAVPSRGSLAQEAFEAISGYGIEVAPVRVGQRMAFVHSLTAGQGVLEYEMEGKAAQEIKELYEWTCTHVVRSTEKTTGAQV